MTHRVVYDQSKFIFPSEEHDGGGLTLREYFAAHAPEPTQQQIESEAKQDAAANPHGDNYKPPRRSPLEIVTDIKFRYANAMVAASERKPR